MKVNTKSIQETLKKAVSNINEKKVTVVAAAVPTASALLSVGASAEGATSTGSTFTVPSIASCISADAFNGILQQITDLLPLLLPVMVGCMALRKGISFLQGMLIGM